MDLIQSEAVLDASNGRTMESCLYIATITSQLLLSIHPGKLSLGYVHIIRVYRDTNYLIYLYLDRCSKGAVFQVESKWRPVSHFSYVLRNKR